MTVDNGTARDRQCGFTFLEMLLTVSIIALVLYFGLPGFRRIVEHERLREVAQTLQGDFMHARAEAIRRSVDLYTAFRTDGGETWCYGTSNRLNCDCRVTDVANASACTIPNPDGTLVLKVVSSDDHRGIRLTSAVFGGSLDYVGFNPSRGTTTQGAGTPLSGSVEFRSPDDSVVRILVNPVGRATPCSTNLAGYKPCP